MLADHTALGYEDDVALCRALPERAGVGAIPPSAFYLPEHRHLAAPWVRLDGFLSAAELAAEVDRIHRR